MSPVPVDSSPAPLVDPSVLANTPANTDTRRAVGFQRYDIPNSGQSMAQATTMAAVKAGLRAVILQITPTHPEYRNKPWARAKSKRDVEGGSIRTFHVTAGNAKRTLAGVQAPEHGEFAFDFRVWTSYSGIDEDNDDGIIGQDGADLELAIRSQYNVLPGFYSATYEAWEPEDSDEGGRLWGAHFFRVTYLQGTS